MQEASISYKVQATIVHPWPETAWAKIPYHSKESPSPFGRTVLWLLVDVHDKGTFESREVLRLLPG